MARNKRSCFKASSYEIHIPKRISSLFPEFQGELFPILEQTTQSTLTKSKRIAVCFSGGPAPGGHDVVCAIASMCHPSHELWGVKGGLGGLLKGDLSPLNKDECYNFLHKGGFDLLRTDRTKLKTKKQFNTVRKHIKQHKLDALIIIGGDDSHTNAMHLAHACLDSNCSIVGVPKTIDGDLQYPPFLPISFGFHSACDLYANLVQNLIRDTLSTHKYWHFVKLMGRHASHTTLEVASQTQPDMYIIGEQLLKDKITLVQLIERIASFILNAASTGKDYGVIVIPEGILEWVYDVRNLLHYLNHSKSKQIPPPLQDAWHLFPKDIQIQLRNQRDPHGNISLSQINTEHLIIDLVTSFIAKHNPAYTLHSIPHFFGYEGRCCAPNTFDQNLCYHLGRCAFLLAVSGHTGYMAACNASEPNPTYYGIPILELMTIENRNGENVPVVKKTVVQ
ncbi:diphosphate--fructose-6-phosphate 1-phosphotransferase [bacterium]|nr:diphosphate--fructose-6-phosphate 1-phosphotransferase [bacterium]